MRCFPLPKPLPRELGPVDLEGGGVREDRPDGPRRAGRGHPHQKRAKRAPRGRQDVPRTLESPNDPPKTPKTASRRPKRPPRRLKRAPIPFPNAAQDVKIIDFHLVFD